MSGAEIGLAVSVFLACAVEAVEALTIVLAVGQARSWPAALWGVAVAGLILAVAVAVLGTALTKVPIDQLRIAIGAVLLAFGLHWLRKAVLRAAGRKALHDERAAYREETAEALAAAAPVGRWDAYCFVVAMKAVLIEGFEVVVIVVTLGAADHRVGLAAAAAALAVAVVIAAGFAVRAPLARVPENALKLAVGVLLCSLSVFWIGEGAGVSWPGGDAILLVIVPAVLAAAAAAIRSLRAPAVG